MVVNRPRTFTIYTSLDIINPIAKNITFNMSGIPYSPAKRTDVLRQIIQCTCFGKYLFQDVTCLAHGIVRVLYCFDLNTFQHNAVFLGIE